MTYIFQSLRANGLITPGDRIAIATPIFSPYLEIPVLAEYGLEIVDIRMDEHADWQLPQSRDRQAARPGDQGVLPRQPEQPAVDQAVGRGARPARRRSSRRTRPDLFIVTDDVYGTFADDFVSLFAKCPRNTLCVYSFSKFFGATGWRLGAIALHDDNVFDAALAGLPEAEKLRLDARYAIADAPSRAALPSSTAWSPTAGPWR